MQIKQYFTNLWDKIKAFFKRSESIFLARLEAFMGLAIAAVSSFDWSPLLNLGVDTAMTLKQGVYLGGAMFVKGIVSEWARRRNDPLLAMQQATEIVVETKKVEKSAKKKVTKAVKEATV